MAPWQKLEALRSQLIPSLQEIDEQARSLLRNIARVPAATSRVLFHASRRVGGLAITPLLEDADIWIVELGRRGGLQYRLESAERHYN